ncbi:MAG: hypothetical protein HUU03_13600 [Planctomycetaceae bacterium]|nr:hypothetical protein [Planctomycetaceae bacterium]
MNRYPRPRLVHISAGAKQLYALERKATDAVKAAAVEQGKLLGFDPEKQLYSHCIPHALLQVLDSFEPECGVRAAEAFLLAAKANDLRFNVERPNLLADAIRLLTRLKDILPMCVKHDGTMPISLKDWLDDLAGYEKQVIELLSQ